MSQSEYTDGVLTKFWDDTTRTYHEYDATGVETYTRPYTDDENATADAAAVDNELAENKSTIETNLAADLDAMQAILDQTNANLRADPSQEIKDIAQAVRRLTRIALDDYSGTE